MGKIISNGIEYNGIINNFNMDYRAGVQAITSDNGASYNITFDEPLNTVDYNVYLQSVNYSGQGFATMGYAVSNRTINGFTFTVYNTSSFSAHDIGWTAIPQNSNGISTNDKINYSTTEQKTGEKWIDGKDVYQKTLTGSLSTGDNNISYGITADTVISVVGMANETLPLPYSLDSSSWSIYLVDGSTSGIKIRNGSSIAATTYTLTIKYTKSTT